MYFRPLAFVLSALALSTVQAQSHRNADQADHAAAQQLSAERTAEHLDARRPSRAKADKTPIQKDRPDPCRPPTLQSTCHVSEWEGLFASKSGGAGPVCIKAMCVPNQDPPEPILIDCSYSYGIHNCEVWPQGEGLTYLFTAPYFGVAETSPTPYSVRSFECSPVGGGGFVTVTVTSPTGVSASDSIDLPCPRVGVLDPR
ncbi:hypothetical protein [Pseudomarimonas arenosa]|uniref:Uncharacterized protein n=1 Tax=Pseudomarimonas arenosa TaxID=2774145 RepID=A0AAW3ZNM1_9GAMM|nr:hypothetical protein [Pseudomarimonas arenosa]MBD8527701.1 hypothetical protein [Pseudomarimonas arenosa]